jgi:hypothetical protein
MNEKRFQWLCLRIDCHFVRRQHLQPQSLRLLGSQNEQVRHRLTKVNLLRWLNFLHRGFGYCFGLKLRSMFW